MFGKFILALLITSLTVGGGSLIWPKITKSPRPAPIQQVHDFVMTTAIGQQAANVLGVQDETKVEQINPQKVAQAAVSSVAGAIQERAQQVVIEQAVNQLENQLNQLPPQEQQEIRAKLCTPE